MGERTDPGFYRWCQAVSRSKSFASTVFNNCAYKIQIITIVTLIFFPFNVQGSLIAGTDAIHITAILGDGVIFNCHVEFPGDHPVPYVLQWEKKVSDTGQETPVFIWYESYPTHSGEGYEGRVARVDPDSTYGAASLNLTDIRESDQGWYECKVVFLNRLPHQPKNGTWYHLDVHAPPRFSITPDDVIYVNLGWGYRPERIQASDSIILNCQADGTPTPEILWYKDANPVVPSSTVGIFNDGTELRISTIRHEDIGDYTCIARNGEGQVSHTARVIIAGGAVIMIPPNNQTKLEGEKAMFTCEAKAMPGNVTVRWFRDGNLVREVSSLETRITIRKDGSLIINPVSADDSGNYLCEVSNGIGDPQSASAYLNVEYPAKVTFTPTMQYLPFRLAGVVQCYIKSNPPLQYVTWTKDKRLLEPYQTKDIVIMNNGSLLFTRVNENHEGRYTCTPYNAQGTQGSSGAMEVLVRKPPSFSIEPEPIYQRKVGESVEMHCDAQEAEGTKRPTIQWQRRDGMPLQRNRVKVNSSTVTIESLRRSDFGYYQCVASNEVATIVSATQLVIEGTQPHAPYNISGTADQFSVTIIWMPGYSGGPDYKQEYTIWYREYGASDWLTIPVTPSGSTQVTINRLSPGTTYEFQIVGKNELGDGMMSKLLTLRTLDGDKKISMKTTTVSATTNEFTFTTLPPNYGPKPGQPRNLTVTEIPNGFLLSWQQPLERANIVQFYTIKYRTDGNWKTLNRGQIRPEETSYLVKNLVGGRTYYFRVLANSLKSYETSEEVKFPVPARVKHKAITAGVVGGILFFIVAIILSICAVKICNKRKRRKQEKAYNMVACRITDTRNAASRTGSASSSQVPLKKYYPHKIPCLKSISTILQWIWPSDRCANCKSIYSISSEFSSECYLNTINKTLDNIHRSADGRFIVGATSIIASMDEPTDAIDYIENRPTSAGSDTSTDDGGFLLMRTDSAQWRRNPVSMPITHSSYYSLLQPIRSEYNGLLKIGQTVHPSLRTTTPIDHHIPSNDQNFNMSMVSSDLGRTPHILHKSSRIISSSPATSSPTEHISKYSPNVVYFSDLSSVKYPSSTERSFPNPNKNGLNNQLRFLHKHYSQEFPSLRAIHEESRGINHGFLPLEIEMHSPAWRYRDSTTIPSTQHNYHHHHKPRSRVLSRYSKISRSTPNLSYPLSQMNIATHLIEASPESRSSSSGFGSKNTSSQQNQSSRSGSTHEWRLLPPYRPPPPPSYTHAHIFPIGYDEFAYSLGESTHEHHKHMQSNTDEKSIVEPPHTMNHWLDIINQLNAVTRNVTLPKSADAGSVDGHYEFDPATPTPTTSSPTIGLLSDPHTIDSSEISTITSNYIPYYHNYLSPRYYQSYCQYNQNQMTTFPTVHVASTTMPISTPSSSTTYRKRLSKFDNIEARVQAMKAEFFEYRKRQKMRGSGVELESAC